MKKGNLGSGAMSETFSALDDFIAKAEGGEIGGAQLRRFLKGARAQASLLGELARNPGTTDRQIIMAILESGQSSRWSKVGEWFRELWEKADNFVLFERALQGAFLVYSTWQVSGTWGEKGMEEALRLAGAEVAMLVGFMGTGAVMYLANAMIENAKDLGYDIAVSMQEWREFLAGISSVKGYEGSTGLEISIEKLATSCPSPEEVQRKVELQADNISKLKETGAPQESEATARSREAIREKLISNMTPIVLAEWFRTRKGILIEYIDLALELDYRWNNLVLRAVCSPPLVTIEENGPVSAEVRIENDAEVQAIQDLVSRMERKIEPLGEPGKLVQLSFNGSVAWNYNGQERETKLVGSLRDLYQPQTFEFPGRGSHELTATVQLNLNIIIGGGSSVAADVAEAQPLLERNFERKIPITVEVATIARAKVEPIPTAKLSTPKEAAVGEVFKLTWDRSQVPNFKPGKYRVMLAPPGTRFTMSDLMLLTFDPTGGLTGEHFRHPVQVVSEKEEGDRVEIEVQVSRVTEIRKPEAFDLAFLFLDKDASMESQLDKAMADLNKAQEDLDKKMESMSPEEREALIKKMEEAAEKAAANPPPTPEKAEDEPLPPGNAISYPILVRPVGISAKSPEGWEKQSDDRPHMLLLKKESGPPEAGNHVRIDARLDIVLDDATTDFAAVESASDVLSLAGKNATNAPFALDGFKGQMARQPVQRDEDKDRPWLIPRTLSQGGAAVLSKGSVRMRLSFSAAAAGWRKTHQDEKGKEVVDYDTRDAAEEQFAGLKKEIDSLIASIKIGAGRQEGGIAPPPDTAPKDDAWVRLVAAKTSCEVNEWVEIQAVVENSRSAEGPFRYEWGGNHAGSGEKVTFFASQPGPYSVTVMVYGAKGLIGSTSVTITVQ